MKFPNQSAIKIFAGNCCIIFSMTKTKRKNAKRMMNGKGPILDDVDRAVQFAAKYVQEDKKRTVMVPVVLFFERKQ